MSFKVGDKVKYHKGKTPCPGEPPEGMVGVVREAEGVRAAVFFEEWDGGGMRGKGIWYTDDHFFTLVEKSEEKSGFHAGQKVKNEDIELVNEKSETPQFKSGMKVRIVKDECGHNIPNGTVVELGDQFSLHDRSWLVKGRSVYVLETDIEIAKELIGGTEKHEFKTGMKCKVIGNSCGHGIALGAVIFLRDRRNSTTWNVSDTYYFVDEKDIEPVKDENLSGNLAVDCASAEEWEKVNKKAMDAGWKWSSDKSCNHPPVFPSSPTNYALYIRKDKNLSWDKTTDVGKSYNDSKIISAAEYLGEKTTQPEVAKRLIPIFGNTPTVLDYPPEPVKQPEKIESHHCPICRADTRCEGHKLGSPCSPDKNPVVRKSTPPAIKTISDKPNKKAFDIWFESIDKKLMT